jgi:hypothetical protein
VKSSLTALGVALVAVALAVALGPACSIESRSDDFRCSNPGQCGAGRDCVDGWCVEDPAEIDASSDCPPACTSCMNGVCIINCNEPGACTEPVICPTDLPCQVRCGGDGACAGGVRCATKSCDVQCSGAGSCMDGINCDQSCGCITSCTGTGACAGTIDCPGNCTQGGQCTTVPPGQCDNC